MAGACDIPDTCDGVSPDCSTDLVLDAGTVCRASGGVCDVEEICDGLSGACPTDSFADAGFTCRSSTGVCDIAETCDGTGASCPPDVVVDTGTPCRASGGACDVAEVCDGVNGACPADSFVDAGFTCRADAGACDVAETCSGNSASCPEDALSPDGTSCSDETYCNGEETCSGGTCTAGTAVVCVDPQGQDVLRCDETSASCLIDPTAPPVIAADMFPTGAVGVPYAYNERGAINVAGSRPITFGSCSGPAEFRVEPSTGAVTWTPPAAGLVSLCVSATSIRGQDQRSFTVDVAAAPGPNEPSAAFNIDPPIAGTSELIVLDATPSADGNGRALAGYRWELNDMGPLWTGELQHQSYLLPGGYQVALTVIDPDGRNAAASAPAIVHDSAGQRPPAVRIVPSAVDGTDSLTVHLSAQATAGDLPLRSYLWRIGDVVLSGAEIDYTFGPGRYRVRLAAVDTAGLPGWDMVEIAVSRGAEAPPHCRDPVVPPPGRDAGRDRRPARRRGRDLQRRKRDARRVWLRSGRCGPGWCRRVAPARLAARLEPAAASRRSELRMA